MLNKRKIALVLVPVMLVGMGFWLVNTNTDLQKNLAAFLLNIDVVANATDGTATPDWRFIRNHKVTKTADVKETIVIPEELKQITENHCEHLVNKMDDGKSLDKYEVAYTIMCYDQYPKYFVNFFTTVETKTAADNRLRPAAAETTPAVTTPATTTTTTTTTPGTTTTDTTTTTPDTTTQPVDDSVETLL